MAARVTVVLAAAALAVAAAPPGARAAAAYPHLVVADGALAGYWAFNEPSGPVTADLRTTGEGVHRGGVRPGAPPLLGSGHSARYDGRHTATIVGNSRRLNPGAAVSVEAWTQPGEVRHAATLAGKRGQYALGFDRQGRAVFRVWAGGAQHRVASAPGTLVKGLIAHLAGTYDGREMPVFANGIVGGSAPVAGRLGRTPSPLVIGGGLRGRLDDVAVYARALDEPTLTAHENAGRAA